MKQTIQESPATKDALGLDVYFDGLAKYIRECRPPMTIAIQGGWGSGKTTAMNIVRSKLEKGEEGEEKTKILTLNYNTWQYAWASDGTLLEPLLINMIRTISERIEQEKLSDKWDDYAKKHDLTEKGFTFDKFKKVLVGTAIMAGQGVLERVTGGGTLERVEAAMKTDDPDDIADIYEPRVILKDYLNHLIAFLVENTDYDRVVFFVDDLDRLDPPKAVEFLEAIKLFVDHEHIVFVLALDHEIVFRGLRDRYGDSMDHKYAMRFFDKIIQLPFNLPQGRYDIGQYVQSLVEDEKDAEEYTAVLKSFRDTNPRTIKRVLYSMDLYESIRGEEWPASRGEVFALLLLQMNHEDLYKSLVSVVSRDLSSAALLFGDGASETREWFEEDIEKNLRKALAARFLKKEESDQEMLRRLSDILGLTALTYSIGDERQEEKDLEKLVGETSARVAEYLEEMGFEPDPDVKDGYRHDKTSGVEIVVSAPGQGDHLNLNIHTGELADYKDSESRQAFLEAFLTGAGFTSEECPVYTGKAPSYKETDTMDILSNGNKAFAVRNVSIRDHRSMQLAGLLIRNIAAYGKVFGDFAG